MCIVSWPTQRKLINKKRLESNFISHHIRHLVETTCITIFPFRLRRNLLMIMLFEITFSNFHFSFDRRWVWAFVGIVGKPPEKQRRSCQRSHSYKWNSNFDYVRILWFGCRNNSHRQEIKSKFSLIFHPSLHSLRSQERNGFPFKEPFKPKKPQTCLFSREILRAYSERVLFKLRLRFEAICKFDNCLVFMHKLS